MNVLVGCEYSATVREAFVKRGHDAYSNDIKPSDIPGRHIQGDVLAAIRSRPRWNLIILHVPCTAMAVCGNKHYGIGQPKHQERIDAVAWTLKVWDAACERSDAVVLENPTSVIFPILRNERGADVQYIHPWQHGHFEQKKTGLALRNLPRIVPTDDVHEFMMALLPKRERERIFHMPPTEDRGHERSRFYQGFADAMADQWGTIVIDEFDQLLLAA